MNDDLLRYDLMIETSLRNVVRETLATVAQNGLPGEHHFYITFLTGFPGVEIPDYLRKQYAEEMTIVLQYQFFGLKVDSEAFGVTLSFNNIKERLRIPIKAITTFADPSVNFALQFQSAQEPGDEDIPHADKRQAETPGNEDSLIKGSDKKKLVKEKTAPDQDSPPSEKRGEVISLDLFRKK